MLEFLSSSLGIYIGFVVLIIEIALSSSWIPSYFRKGIAIYKKQYPHRGTAIDPINEDILNDAFKKYITSSMVFKNLGNGEYAFREKMFQLNLFSYVSIMRGWLEINEFTKEIQVIGHINWTPIVFIVATIIMFPLDSFFIVVLFIFLGVSYLFQKRKYDDIGQFAYEWNSRNWS